MGRACFTCIGIAAEIVKPVSRSNSIIESVVYCNAYTAWCPLLFASSVQARNLVLESSSFVFFASSDSHIVSVCVCCVEACVSCVVFVCCVCVCICVDVQFVV